jgi:hypothetical protein
VGSVRPEPGWVPADAPLEIQVELSGTIEPSAADRVTFGGIEVAPEWAADRRSFRVVTAPPPAGFALWLEAELTDVFDRPVALLVGPYASPSLRFSFDQDVWTNGVVQLEPVAEDTHGDPAHFEGAILYAGPYQVAVLGPPPWAPVAWDTRAVPEGAYELRVAAPGAWSSGPAAPVSVHVDRTPPTVSCSPAAPEPSPSLDVWYGVRLTASELVLHERPTLVALGRELPLVVPAHGSFGYPPYVIHLGLLGPGPTPPYVLTGAVGAEAVDRAGNPAGVTACSFEVTPWLAPLGSGPVGAPDPVVASELALHAPRAGLYVPDAGPVPFTLAWIAGPSSASAGELCVVRRTTASSEPCARLSSQASSPSLTRWRAAWSEAGRARLASWSEASGRWSAEEGPIPSGGSAPFVSSGHYDRLVWLEAAGEHRTLGGAGAEPGGGWSLISGDVRLDPANDVTHATGSGLLAVFLEDVGGVPQIRAAWNLFFGLWSALDGSLNLDPAAPASDPAAAQGGAVAWIEGGQVLARIIEGPMGFTAGDPAVLNVDPSRAARWTRATTSAGRPTVVFVETGSGGDEIWVRRYEDGAWTLLPGPVNADAPGPVTALAASFGPSIAWADEAGHVRVRVFNQ